MNILKNLFNLSPKATSIGFVIAGAYNLISILGFTQFFTNTTLMTTDPIVFSWVGQIGIILWGLAYLSQVKKYTHNMLLIAVFCVEKILYAVAWLLWLIQHGKILLGLFSQSAMMGIFFSVYGLGDFLLGIFFGITAWRIWCGDFQQPEKVSTI